MGNELSLLNGAGKKQIVTYKRRKSHPYFTPLAKINSKWIKDLNVKLDTAKLLGRKHRERTP